MNDSKVYDVKEVSELLGVTKATIRRWHRNGQIKTVQIGQGWIRIPESEVKRLLGEQ